MHSHKASHHVLVVSFVLCLTMFRITLSSVLGVTSSSGHGVAMWCQGLHLVQCKTCSHHIQLSFLFLSTHFGEWDEGSFFLTLQNSFVCKANWNRREYKKRDPNAAQDREFVSRSRSLDCCGASSEFDFGIMSLHFLPISERPPNVPYTNMRRQKQKLVTPSLKCA